MGLDPELDLSDHVVKKAKLAIDSGVCGVVASAQEAKLLRDNLGNDFKIVTPGIRFEESLTLKILLNFDSKISLACAIKERIRLIKINNYQP